MSIKYCRIRSYQKGLYFKNGEFEGLLNCGKHFFFNPFVKEEVYIADLRNPWLRHEKLDLIIKSGVLEGKAAVLDIKDFERALVWVDGRFQKIIGGGLYALWTTHKQIDVQIADARTVRFEHKDISVILNSETAEDFLQEHIVEAEHTGVLFINGRYAESLPAGRYVFWKDIDVIDIKLVPMSEITLDVNGQEMMTADKVTVRVNAVVAYKVVDAAQTVRYSKDTTAALYREVQLAVREAVAAKVIDELLTQKKSISCLLQETIAQRAQCLGLKVVSFGIRDLILPGDMRELFNKVTEAKKTAEANLIARREETAAIRSQANTAKLLEDNPVLMRMLELEVLEKISGNSKISVVLGEKGLADKVVNLL